MVAPIKNEETEKFAKDLAAAILADNNESYEKVMKENEAVLNNMKRWEILAFQRRVHFLVEGF